MDLSVPVLARDIPGNAAVVRHEHSGLLYSSPEVRFRINLIRDRKEIVFTLPLMCKFTIIIKILCLETLKH